MRRPAPDLILQKAMTHFTLQKTSVFESRRLPPPHTIQRLGASVVCGTIYYASSSWSGSQSQVQTDNKPKIKVRRWLMTAKAIN